MLKRTVAALSDGGAAALFLITWLQPTRFGDQMVSHLTLVMGFEFFVVHSTALTWGMFQLFPARRYRVKAVLALTAFYSVFIIPLALIFRSWWPITAFAGLTLNRGLSLFADVIRPSGGGREKGESEWDFWSVGLSWALSVALYVVGVNLALFVPVPRLGITEAFVRAGQESARGVWLDEPQRALAFGVFYFGTLALLQLLGYPGRLLEKMGMRPDASGPAFRRSVHSAPSPGVSAEHKRPNRRRLRRKP